MTDQQPEDRAATDSTEMTEGVGGVPGIDDDERAMVSDPDGDNVDDREQIREQADGDGTR